MIKIDNETKEFIRENKDLLSSASIFNMLKDKIDFLLENNIKISNIHKILERELEIKINIKSLYSYLRRNKNKKRIAKDTHNTKNITKSDSHADKNIPKILGII